VLALRGCGRAIGMEKAKLKSGRRCIGGDLHADGPGQHGMQHERIGGDPADKSPPKSQPSSSNCGHPCALPRAVAFWRAAPATVQNYRLKN